MSVLNIRLDDLACREDPDGDGGDGLEEARLKGETAFLPGR